MKRLWLILAIGCASAPSLSPLTNDACTFAIGDRGGDRVVVYQAAAIVGEANSEEWLLRLQGNPYVVNFPKSRVLRRGESRIVSNKVCRCPEAP